VDGSDTYKLDNSHFYVGTDNGYIFGTSGVVAFGIGETSQVVTVAVKTDAVGDFDRTFGLTLSTPSTGSAIASDLGFAQAAVLNDDPALHVELQPSNSGDHHYLEGTSTGTLVSFKVIRTGSTAGVATTNWQIQTDGTDGTNMADWGGYWPSGNVVFADGQSEKTVQVRIAGDNIYEPNEGFKVVLSNATNATLIDDHALSSGVVVNDDNGVSVTAQQLSLVEGDSGVQYATFEISVQGVAGKHVTANYQVEGSGSVPANPNDFEGGWLPNGSVDLTVGSDGTATTTVQVGVNGDRTYGPDETFRLRITSVINGSIAKASEEMTIVNDDSLVSISQTLVSQAEGNSGSTEFHYTVTRTGDLSREAVVAYSVEGLGDNQATASDFVNGILPTDQIVFGIGQSSYDLVILVQGDTTFESDKSFAVRLVQLSPNDVSGGQNAAAIDPAAALARGVILNDDSAGLVVNGLVTTVTEGSSASDPHYLSYEIVRNGDASHELMVNYTLAQDGAYDLPSASAFVDGLLTGSIVLAAGQSRTVLNLAVAPNTTPGSDLHFVLTATAVGMAVLTNPVASTVLDDDSGITVHVDNSTNVDQLEGAVGTTTGYDFVVERAGSNLGTTDVDWSLAGVGTNPANAADFIGGVLPSGTLHFDFGVSSQIIHVDVRGDSVIEPDKVFRVNLDSSSDTTQKIQIASADAVILNDDVVTSGNDEIYGSSGPNTLNGYGGNDIIHGGIASDMLFGGDGNDMLYGGGGADQIYGGAGNDTLVINAANLSYLDGASPLLTLDGGTGIDTLTLDGSGLTFDLTNLHAQIASIEKIDINGRGANTLLLDQAFLAKQAMNLFNVDGDLNVRDDYHQLLVDGGSDDLVVIDLAAGWDKQTNQWSYAGNDYDVYVNKDTASELMLKVGLAHQDHV